MAGSGCKDPQTVSETVAEATGQAGGAEGSERRLGVLPCCRAGWVEGRATYLMPILRQNSGRSRAPPLVLRAGHVHEAVAADEHVARVDRLPEVDDCAVALVLSCAAGSQSTRTSTYVNETSRRGGMPGSTKHARDVRGGSRLFLFPDPPGLHNPATAPLAEKGERFG